MKEIKANVNIASIDLIEKLIYAIEKYYKDMPEELREIIKEIDKTGYRDFSVGDFFQYASFHGLDHKKLVTIPEVEGIVSWNKHLKRVLRGDGCYIDLDSFCAKIGNHVIVEW